MSSECNKDIPEPSLPIAKKGRKGTMKGRRPKYVLRLPSQKAPILESPVDQQNPSTTANVVPIPSQPSIVESTPSQPSIDQPIPSQPPLFNLCNLMLMNLHRHLWLPNVLVLY